jgi:hypothetical protein
MLPPDTSRRSIAVERAGRIALGVGALVLSYFSVTFSIAQLIVKDNPALARALAPYDGTVAASLAASLAGPDASMADRRRADALAREALKRDATSVVALSTLGIDAQVRGDSDAARRYFGNAEHLSRRDVQTQLWGIEDAVGRGKIDEALRHYNIALRVSPRLSDLLFPVLASASAEPEVRRELVRTLATKPLWSNSFVNYVANNGPDPRKTAQLFSDLTRKGVVVPDYARAALINALIVRGHPDRAWAYYATRRGVDRNRSRDPRFAANLETPSQLDWLPTNGASLTTSIQNGIFYFAAPPSVGGALLQQVQYLTPGDYALSGHTTDIDQADDSRPYWVLRCQDGKELGRVDMPNSSAANGRFTGRFRVSADCPLQTLALMARPSGAAGGLSGQIDWVQLEPVQ